MANYVDRDGDWSQRPPAHLEGVTIHLFVLPAHTKALQALCDQIVNDRPTGGTVTAEPLFPAVLLMCASIDHLRSTDGRDGQRGYIVEKDLGFIVPIKLTNNGLTSFAGLMPYLFVEPFAPVVVGREVYGFPKELGKMTFDEAALDFKAESLVIPEYDPNKPAVLKEVVRVTPTGPVVRVQFAGDIFALTQQLIDDIHKVLGLTVQGTLGAPAAGFIEAPVVLLKQFRDAADPVLACYQALVRAFLTGDNLQSAEFITGIINVKVPAFDSLNIEATLGLFDPIGLGQPFHSLLSLSFKLNVELSLGDVLWQA